jgi:hypothetical protein
MVGEVLGGRAASDQGGIDIGSPVQVVFEKIDDDLTLAQWEVVG